MDPRSLLEREFDDAIRTGLRDAGVRGVLAPHVANMLGLILHVLERHEPTVDEVAEDIRSRNGFLRAGDDAVLSDGRHASPRLLTDALLKLWREEHDDDARTATVCWELRRDPSDRSGPIVQVLTDSVSVPQWLPSPGYPIVGPVRWFRDGDPFGDAFTLNEQ